MTAVAAFLILKEPLGLRGAAGVLLSLVGLMLLAQPPFIFGGAVSSSSVSVSASIVLAVVEVPNLIAPVSITGASAM